MIMDPSCTTGKTPMRRKSINLPFYRRGIQERALSQRLDKGDSLA